MLRRSLRRRIVGHSSSPPARPPAQMVPGPSCSRDTGACEAGRKRAAPTHARGAAQPPAQSLQSSRVRDGGYAATPTPGAGCGSRCNTARPSWTHAVEAWASAGSAGPPMGFGRFGVGTVGGASAGQLWRQSPTNHARPGKQAWAEGSTLQEKWEVLRSPLRLLCLRRARVNCESRRIEKES